jgi:hypothetical protein
MRDFWSMSLMPLSFALQFRFDIVRLEAQMVQSRLFLQKPGDSAVSVGFQQFDFARQSATAALTPWSYMVAILPSGKPSVSL